MGGAVHSMSFGNASVHHEIEVDYSARERTE